MEYSKFKYDENNKYHRFGKTLGITFISLILLLEAWWIASLLANSSFLPTPLETWDALVSLYTIGDPITGRTMWQYIAASMSTFLKGFVLALVVAVPLGLVIGYSRIVRQFTNPILEILRPIAPIAWAPIFIYGINYTVGPILVVFIGIFFPLLTNVIFGVMKIDQSLIDASKTLGASKLQTFTKVMIPSAVPYTMNGIKIGLGVGWMCIVAAEMFAPINAGIGYYLQEQSSVVGSGAGAFAALVIIAILGLLTIGLADYIHRVIVKRMGMEE